MVSVCSVRRKFLPADWKDTPMLWSPSKRLKHLATC